MAGGLPTAQGGPEKSWIHCRCRWTLGLLCYFAQIWIYNCNMKMMKQNKLCSPLIHLGYMYVYRLSCSV